jgi:beta-mannosidase
VDRDDAGWFLRVSAARAALFVHVTDETGLACENWFHLAPNREKHVRLDASPGTDPARRPSGQVGAINMAGQTRYDSAVAASAKMAVAPPR